MPAPPRLRTMLNTASSAAVMTGTTTVVSLLGEVASLIRFLPSGPAEVALGRALSLLTLSIAFAILCVNMLGIICF